MLFTNNTWIFQALFVDRLAYPDWFILFVYCLIKANTFIYGLITHFLGIKAAWITSVILAPILEEIEFRGIIYKIKDTTNNFLKYGLVSLTSIIFGLCHCVPIGFTCIIISMGFLCCWLVLKTKRLWTSIALHSTYNLLIIIYTII